MPVAFSSTGLPHTTPKGADPPEWQWNRLPHSIDPTSDLPRTFTKSLREEFEKTILPVLTGAAAKLGGGTANIVLGLVSDLNHKVLGDDKVLSSALVTVYELMHTGLMKPLEVGETYRSEQGKRTAGAVRKAEQAATVIQSSTVVARPVGLRAYLDPRKLSFDLSANVAGHAWPMTVGAKRKAAAQWCLSSFRGARGSPFSVAEVEQAFGESKGGKKKGKKKGGAGKKVVPENAPELAVEAVQWLVRHGLLDVVADNDAGAETASAAGEL